MEKSAISIFICLVLLACARAATLGTTVNNFDLMKQNSYVTAYPTPNVPLPNFQQRNLNCISGTNARGLQGTPLFPTAEAYLRSKAIAYFYLSLVCVDYIENTYTFIYLTSQGVARLTLYSNSGYTTVINWQILDPSIGITKYMAPPF